MPSRPSASPREASPSGSSRRLGPPDEGAEGSGGATPSTSDLFAVLWNTLSDLLGSAAAATLLRRAAHRAAVAWPELGELSITRERLEYSYRAPASWSEPAPDAPPALCALVAELWTLLLDLTGPVVVDRLVRIPELRDRGIVPPFEGPR